MYSHRHVILHLPNFVVIRRSSAELWRYIYFFKMAAGSHIGFDLGNVKPSTSAIARLSLILKFGFDRIYSYWDIAIFEICRFGWKLPIHAHYFWGVLGAYSSKYGHSSFWPPKDHPCAETRRLSHKAWKSVQRFDLGVGSRKKGKDRTVKKSHKVITFRLFG